MASSDDDLFDSREVGACPRISVNAKSFAEDGHRELMLAAVAQADIVAIDTEFTGLAADATLSTAFNDTLASRYCRVRHAAGKIALTQFGMCTLRYDAASASWKSVAFGVYVFPGSRGRVITAEASALAFLRDNGFSFDAFVRGVPYRSLAEVERRSHCIRQAERARALMPQRPMVLDDPMLVEQVAALASTLRAWLGRLAAGQSAADAGPPPPAPAAAEESPPAAAAGEATDAASTAAGEARRPRRHTFQPRYVDVEGTPAIVLPPSGGRHRKITHDLLAMAFPGLWAEQTESSDTEHFEAAAATAGVPPPAHYAKPMRILCLSPPADAAAPGDIVDRLCSEDGAAWTEETPPSHPLVLERRMARLDASLEELAALEGSISGFSAVFAAIGERGCPIVVHNGLLDAVHCMSAFVGELPPSPEAFCSSLRREMPRLFDTKSLLGAEPLLSGDFSSTGLEQAFATASGPDFGDAAIGPDNVTALAEAAGLDADAIERLRLAVAEDDGSSSVAHDAGHDAWMTGAVFVRALSKAGMPSAEVAGLRSTPLPSEEAVAAAEASMSEARGAGWLRRQWFRKRQREEGNSEAAGRSEADPQQPAASTRTLSTAADALAAHGETINLIRTSKGGPRRWRLALPMRHDIHEPWRAEAEAEAEATAATAALAAAVQTGDAALVPGEQALASSSSSSPSAAASGAAVVAMAATTDVSSTAPVRRAAAPPPALGTGPKACVVRVFGLNSSLRIGAVASMTAAAAGLADDEVRRSAVLSGGQGEVFVTLESFDQVRRVLAGAAAQRRGLLAKAQASAAADRAAGRVPAVLAGLPPRAAAALAAKVPPGDDAAAIALLAQDDAMSPFAWPAGSLPMLGAFGVETYAHFVRARPEVFAPGVLDFEFEGLPADLVDGCSSAKRASH